MFIKFSPCKSDSDTQFYVKDINTFVINGTEYEFDNNSIMWTNICSQTNGDIIEAYRENGELYITIIRKYTRDCGAWDNGQYNLNPTYLGEAIQPYVEPTSVEEPLPLEEPIPLLNLL